MPKPLTDLEKLLATAEACGRKIPDCEHLLYDYNHLWTEGDKSNIREVRRGIRRAIRKWIRQAEEAEIIKIVDQLHPETKKALNHILPFKYRHYFKPDHGEMPNEFAAPSPFVCLPIKEKNWISLPKPKIFKYGETTVIVKGVALNSFDGATTLALLQLRKHKKWHETTRKNISYFTSIVEIGKIMCSSNPWSKTEQEAIWRSLERLRGSVITIINGSGKRTLGGIIDGATELVEDSTGELELFLDRNIVDMVEMEYTQLDPNIYFKLRSRARNLYKFLMRQESFNQFRCLNKISIKKVYDFAGLGGLQSNKKMSEIRYELKKTLEQLKKEGIIDIYSIRNDQLEITGLTDKKIDKKEDPGNGTYKNDTDDTKKVKTKFKRTKIRSKHKCPYGHRFGIDFDNDEDCFDCSFDKYGTNMNCEKASKTRKAEPN